MNKLTESQQILTNKKNISILENINKFLIPIIAFLLAYTFNDFKTQLSEMKADIKSVSEIKTRLSIIEYKLNIPGPFQKVNTTSMLNFPSDRYLLTENLIFIKPEEYEINRKDKKHKII